LSSCYEKQTQEHTKKDIKMISTLRDLNRWFSDQIENIDINAYNKPFDDLVEFGSENFLELIKSCGFTWGDCIPDEITEKQVFECLSEFEI
jgi:hypothetical protein